MINSVRVINDFRNVDETLTLGEVSNGITVKPISGLGPVKAELITTKKASGDGVNYSSRKVGSRNIVFSFGLSEVGLKTIEEVRRDIYDYFPVGEESQFVFDTKQGLRYIVGRIESVEPEIFSKDPSMQVSVICVDPYFRDSTLPFAHTVTLPTTPDGALVNYHGKVDTGVNIEILVTDQTSITFGHVTILQDAALGGPFVGFNIEDFDLQGITGYPLTIGDRILISTTPGKKSATLTRGSTIYNILGAIKDTGGIYLNESQWPKLYAGDRVAGWSTTFTAVASVFSLSQLQIKVSWDELIEGL